VLAQMVSDHFITAAQANAANAEPVLGTGTGC
jgi:membrane carboxypeptidase/penicillin-binding protein